MFQDSLWELQDNRSKENLARWLTMPKPASRTWLIKPFSHWMRLWSSSNQLSPDPSTKSTQMGASMPTLFILTITLLSKVMDNKSLNRIKEEEQLSWSLRMTIDLDKRIQEMLLLSNTEPISWTQSIIYTGEQESTHKNKQKSLLVWSLAESRLNKLSNSSHWKMKMNIGLTITITMTMSDCKLVYCY